MLDNFMFARFSNTRGFQIDRQLNEKNFNED